MGDTLRRELLLEEEERARHPPPPHIAFQPDTHKLIISKELKINIKNISDSEKSIVVTTMSHWFKIKGVIRGDGDRKFPFTQYLKTLKPQETVEVTVIVEEDPKIYSYDIKMSHSEGELSVISCEGRVCVDEWQIQRKRGDLRDVVDCYDAQKIYKDMVPEKETPSYKKMMEEVEKVKQDKDTKFKADYKRMIEDVEKINKEKKDEFLKLEIAMKKAYNEMMKGKELQKSEQKTQEETVKTEEQPEKAQEKVQEKVPKKVPSIQKSVEKTVEKTQDASRDDAPTPEGQKPKVPKTQQPKTSPAPEVAKKEKKKKKCCVIL